MKENILKLINSYQEIIKQLQLSIDIHNDTNTTREWDTMILVYNKVINDLKQLLE